MRQIHALNLDNRKPLRPPRLAVPPRCRRRYNPYVMNAILIRVWPLALVVLMVALPAAGPLLDHHFAERQPYHAHVGADSSHRHDYRAAHIHPVDPATGESSDAPSPGAALVLYSFEVSSPMASIAILANSNLNDHLTTTAADSPLAIRAATEAAFVSALVPVPRRPPRA